MSPIRGNTNIYKYKKHFIKILKDVGMVLPKIKENKANKLCIQTNNITLYSSELRVHATTK